VNVLVTGGAGYIGAHVVSALVSHGDHVVIVDDLVTGTAARVGDVPIVQLDLAHDTSVDLLAATLSEHNVDTVVHFAARKQVNESVQKPAWYYRENVGGLANLLLAMERVNVTRLIFSSSAAVYAAADHPLTELDLTEPLNPYGETKLVGEKLVSDSARAWGLQAVSLRYFNVAGAGSPELGDTAALNLVPMVFEKLDAGKSPLIFGGDYPTPDGTCVRDYVHVQDVAEAHLAALTGLDSLGSGHHLFNVGTGQGASVREIVDAILDVSGSTATAEVAPRRAGDHSTVVAAVDQIKTRLGWSARFSLDDIIRSAWEAHEHLHSAP